jgi:hypothetical protein
VTACAPTFDWRDWRGSGTPLQAQFPCKPASHARSVMLAGAKVEMAMHACTAGDITFALTHADLADPALVGPALTELARAAALHLQATAPARTQTLSVPGMTPQAQAVTMLLSGRLAPDRPVQERLALFAHGTRVYQATMIGSSLNDPAQEQFFGALRFDL